MAESSGTTTSDTKAEKAEAERVAAAEARADAAAAKAEQEAAEKAAEAEAQQAEREAEAARAAAEQAQVDAEAEAAKAKVVTDPTEEYRSPLAVANQFESWKSVTRSKISITRIGEFGKPYAQSVPAGTTFTILPRERRLNQQECTRAKFDVFTNGMLSAVELVVGEPDNEALEGNPNIIEKDDIRKILKLKGERFADRISRITAPATLQRLHEAAQADDATVGQLRMVRERLDEVNVPVGHVKPSIDAAMREGKPGPKRDKVDLFEPAELSKT